MSSEYKLCACPLDCFDVCSIRAEIIDGKVIKLEGNKDHPITQGFICEKGRRHLERMYSPQRLKRPMKKVNGEFLEISWEEALDTIAKKLKNYINDYGTLSIAQYNDGGAGGLLKNVENLFFDYLGNVTLFKGSLCWGAGIAAQKSDFGDVKGHSPEDIYNTKTIVIWGRNPVETNIHLVPFIKKARENGAKVILIDPIKTATFVYSDWHIQLKPGGDTAFALAVSKYILENKQYDTDFVENHSKGFDEIKGYLERLSYEELMKVCGIDMNAVKSFAELLTDKPTTIYIGYGLQRYHSGGATVRAIDMLGALAGIIGIVGGGVNYANRVYGDFINWDAVAPSRELQHRYIAKPKLAVELTEIDNPKVKAIFISRSNPAVQLPNTMKAVEALDKIEFKVVLDYFMTDTASLADMILPVTYFMEETDIVYSSMWNGSIFYNEKLVNGYFEAKPEIEIYSLLARKMGMTDFPQMTSEQWISTLLSNTTEIGLDMDVLKENKFSFAKSVQSIPWEDYKFKTSSGRFEFVSPDALMQYLKNQNDPQMYDFKLLTVHMREALHSQFLMDSEQEHPEVFISKEDIDMIESMKLMDGELIKLENQYGSLFAVIRFSDKCQKGVLYMKQGWWFKNGGSVNCLSSPEISDMGNQATYNECCVKIVKLGE
jgi:anaerobic selenocysteine-containing dehydrogenase